jgi:hypothetical protein
MWIESSCVSLGVVSGGVCDGVPDVLEASPEDLFPVGVTSPLLLQPANTTDNRARMKICLIFVYIIGAAYSAIVMQFFRIIAKACVKQRKIVSGWLKNP